MKTIKNILFVTFPTLIIIFIILEIASRLFFPGTYSPHGFWDSENRLFKFDKDYGTTGIITIGNFAQQRAKWIINNDGWNSPINYYSEKKEGVKRIAVIGDSYIEAVQVDIEKSYPYILASLLGNQYEVYSFGVSGAPLSQYLFISRYVEKKFAPDIYIFNLVHNDFDESINGFAYKPYFLTVKSDNGVLTEVKPTPYERAFRKIPLSSLFKKSSFLRYLYGNLHINNIFKIRSKNKNNVEMNIYVDNVIANIELIKSFTAYILKTIKSELEGKEIIFIMDAPRWSIYKGEIEKAQCKELNIMVAQICKGLNIQFIDLTPYMIEDYRKIKKRYETDFDGHWNEYGHSFVANTIFENLRFH